MKDFLDKPVSIRDQVICISMSGKYLVKGRVITKDSKYAYVETETGSMIRRTTDQLIVV